MTKTDMDEQISGWAYSYCHGPVAGIVTVADTLGRPIRYRDDQGYDVVLVAGAVNPRLGRIARVSCRHKPLDSGYVDVTFTLLVTAGDILVGNRELPSYNPFFGCRVRHFDWHDDHVVCIYREKHRTYVLAVGPDNEARHVSIADEWLLEDSIVYSRSETLGFVDSLRLPDLSPLDPLPEDEGRELGLIPPGYDRANEWRRKRR